MHWEARNAREILVRKPEGKIQFGHLGLDRWVR